MRDRCGGLVCPLAVCTVSDGGRPLRIEDGELYGKRARRWTFDDPHRAILWSRDHHGRIFRCQLVEAEAPLDHALVLDAEAQYATFDPKVLGHPERVLERPHVSPSARARASSPRRRAAVTMFRSTSAT